MKIIDVTTINHHSFEEASKQLSQLLAGKVAYLSPEDKNIVELAFWQMAEAHGEQRRKSGEFYIVHPVAVCLLLADMKMDKDTLAGALLHDVPEDTKIGLDELKKVFSNEILFLISGVTKLSQIKYQGEDRYAENLRKMFVSMSKDLRVIFIKLADRIHNLTTLEALSPEKAQRIALESVEIYAPIAERLGMTHFKEIIQEICFRYLHTSEYNQLISLSHVEFNRREKLMKQVSKKVEQILKNSKIEYLKIYGRAKKYSSLHKKLKEKQSLNKIYDLVALRIITKNVGECYEILSLLHRNFEQIGDRVKDYIENPKDNGYQSIHTTLHDSRLKFDFEVQIRTAEMHEFAEYGVASHWSYKQGVAVESSSFLDKDRMKWIRELLEIGKEKLSEEEYLKYIRLDLFKDRIFVMTPKGDAIDLPSGATALDFAFRIHVGVGSKAIRAMVNGELQKISYELKNGDVVFIDTEKNQIPRRSWLDIVKTRHATRSIKSILRKRGEVI
jgi:GTP pyrophosphokinase